MESTLEEKFKAIFSSGYSISFQNEVRRNDSEWYSRITWKHIQQPGGGIIKQCEWFGFDNIEECVDDCLTYVAIKSL
jgi:hypothetical protein